MILSSGVLKTEWIAIVSSTTPRFVARCPPVSDTVSNIFSLISSANISLSFILRGFKSSG